jgi:hypothetical protein
MRHLPRYGFIGLMVMIMSEAGMLLRIEPFLSWHTPIVWTGYILFVDGLVWSRRASSWLTVARSEFAFLVAMSVPLWLVFEFYNRFIQNWHYVNLPPNVALRTLGYAWSFATIWPAIFETSDLVASLRRGPVERAEANVTATTPSGSWWPLVSMIAGAGMLIWPLVWPSPYLAAPVWLGFIFLLDPLNARLGAESLTGDCQHGRHARAMHLLIAGLCCGFLWEFWNYWARTKWVYTVPILPNLKLFEMPLPGYLGFPAFALECFVMYVCVRRLLWRGPLRAIGL